MYSANHWDNYYKSQVNRIKDNKTNQGWIF